MTSENSDRQAARAAAWERIQTEAPDVALLLKDFRRVFGQRACSRVEVTLGGEQVLPLPDRRDEG